MRRNTPVRTHTGFFAASLFLVRQRGIVYRYKDEAKRLFAIRFNPHHNRRMHLASAKGQLVHIWNLEDKDDASGSTRGVRSYSMGFEKRRAVSLGATPSHAHVKW